MRYNNVQAFGGFPDHVFLDIYKQVDTKHVPAGDFLFKAGDPDREFYVVLEGELLLRTVDADGRSQAITAADEGKSVVSMLALLEALTGCKTTRKHFSAIAISDATVLVVPYAVFEEVCGKRRVFRRR
jgi:CRP-like cAMP-binding protein